MGFMDDMKDKMSNTEQMRARYDELRRKEQETGLDDKGREELNQLRSHLSKQP